MKVWCICGECMASYSVSGTKVCGWHLATVIKEKLLTSSIVHVKIFKKYNRKIDGNVHSWIKPTKKKKSRKGRAIA
jgi:hypothetical protein